jgi:hypothetical protein
MPNQFSDHLAQSKKSSPAEGIVDGVAADGRAGEQLDAARVLVELSTAKPGSGGAVEINAPAGEAALRAGAAGVVAVGEILGMPYCKIVEEEESRKTTCDDTGCRTVTKSSVVEECPSLPPLQLPFLDNPSTIPFQPPERPRLKLLEAPAELGSRPKPPDHFRPPID